jgi:DNA-binding CsgD family transcriptional regulator
MGRQQRESAMDRRTVVVETGLDERAGAMLDNGRVVPRTRHARTRFVPIKTPVLARAPELGDPWDPLTVRARLERMGETYRRLPGAGVVKPIQPKSCMPEPLRELFKDLPATPLRSGVTDADLAAANRVIDVLTARERGIAWAIANRMSDRELARHLGVHHTTAAARKQDVLKMLAEHWRTLDWMPDAEDINRACRFIHRIID